MNTLSVFNIEGKEVDTIKLDEKIFSDKIITSSVYQVITNYRLNQRKGLASTKTRGEVSGGGRKPWKQKGTGRARIGSIRSPLWRHGGVVFGPHPRDFSYNLPKKIKDAALKIALSAQIIDNKLIVLEALDIKEAKTKAITSVLTNLKINPNKESVLMVVDTIKDDVKRATANVNALVLDLAKNINTYEVLTADKIIITKDAFKEIVKRLKS